MTIFSVAESDSYRFDSFEWMMEYLALALPSAGNPGEVRFSRGDWTLRPYGTVVLYGADLIGDADVGDVSGTVERMTWFVEGRSMRLYEVNIAAIDILDAVLTRNPDVLISLFTAGDDTFYGASGPDILQGGQGDDFLVGNGRGDFLNGNAGNDFLAGGHGKDRLKGDQGYDFFVFEFSERWAIGDLIIDMTPTEDHIVLFSDSFAGLGRQGELRPKKFGIGDMADDVNVRVFYDSSVGHIWYDPDGTGALRARLLARVEADLVLSAGDFLVFG